MPAQMRCCMGAPERPGQPEAEHGEGDEERLRSHEDEQQAGRAERAVEREVARRARPDATGEQAHQAGQEGDGREGREAHGAQSLLARHRGQDGAHHGQPGAQADGRRDVQQQVALQRRRARERAWAIPLLSGSGMGRQSNGHLHAGTTTSACEVS